MDDHLLNDYILEGIDARRAINTGFVAKIAALLFEKLNNGGKLIVFGNGGSAADAQHFAGELTGRFSMERRPYPAIALSTNSSAITAIGNDYSFSEIFERQIQAYATDKDFVVGISTSGNSENVIRGIDVSNRMGAFTLGLSGRNGGKLKEIARETFLADSEKTPVIQEIHIAFIHMICLEFDRLYTAAQKE